MNTEQAFNEYQKLVDADPDHVAEARRRRDAFRRALGRRSDVLAVIPSGSLARRTERDPIHDVDLIVEFDVDDHPDWDGGAGTARASLEHVQSEVMELLGINFGTDEQLVRTTRIRNHVVKCFLDPPEDPDAFVVEVMPALRVGDHLRIPEARDDRWASADPEHLIDAVAQRQSEWAHFVPMVRVIKAWKDAAGLDMKSLVAEVLALNCLPRPYGDASLTRSQALAKFFTAAASQVMSGVHDPAGWCGEIQPALDLDSARAALREAADLASRARAAELNGNHFGSIKTWGLILGDGFPPPDGAATGAAGAAAATVAVIKDAPQG